MSDSQQGQNGAEGTAEVMPASNQPEEQLSELSDDVSERTRLAFEKLKQHNKELAQKVAEKQSASSLLDDLPSQEHIVIPAGNTQFFDANGYVDPVLLNNHIAESQRKAEEAVKKAHDAEKRIQEFEKTQLVREAHAKYPQLDPNSDTFDPLFFDAVKNELVGQLAQGKRDIIAAAKKVETFYQPKTQTAPAEEAKRQKTVTQRQQASSQTGTTKGSSTPIDRAELIAGTRRGEPEAIFKRLQASGM